MSAQGLLALRAADGATVTLERYPILLGRSVPGGTIPDVDVSHLDRNEAVENRHLELTRVPAGVEVHDLGGVSGSWVDGRRLAPGGRALLEPGGSLRVAGVVMTLIELAGALPPLPAAHSRAIASPAATWQESGPAQGIPPPPSAGALVLEDEPQESLSHPLELDLSGAPAVAREPLERGADLVRIRPAAPLEVLVGERWTQLGKPLSSGAVAEAVSSARRDLDIPEEALGGEGHVGDVALEFLLPPLTDRPYLAVRVAARVAAELDPAELGEARRTVLEGAALLVAGRWPEPALAALADRFEASFASTRVLSFGSADWWVPAGWPALDPHHPGAVQEALLTGELFLDQPPDPILEALIRVLPRPGGGTVLALRQHSLVGALEQLARQIDPAQLATTTSWQREEVARLFPLALSGQGDGWRLSLVGVDGQGRWTNEPLHRDTRR
ncbi:MAG TPA: FHA domain-containing protein [Candidatus Dormibacteraeota bacterium]|nr:FHA domain-containing protein [Candidatus Dormibacteraeota bacterium]